MTAYVQGTPVPAAPPPPAPRRIWSTARITGNVLMALWIVAGIWLLFYLGSRIGGEFVANYWDRYLEGVFTTLKLVGASMAIGAAISLPVAMARSSHRKLIAVPAFAYVYFFRGTPLIAQTFLIYYGSGSFQPFLKDVGLWWFFRDAWYCAIFAFSLNTSAYQAEILRGAIRNIDRGQWEAAKALGLGRFITLRKIILPQAMIVALRPYGNELILMIKGSAIASIITIYDIMGVTGRSFSRTYDFQAYIWAAVLYLLGVETRRRIWDRIERRLTRHLERRG